MNVLAAGIFFLGLENCLGEQGTGGVVLRQGMMFREILAEGVVMVDMGGQMVSNPEQSHHICHDHQAQDGPGQGRVGAREGSCHGLILH